MRKMEFSHLGLKLEEKQGVKVIQNGKSYFAHDWQLTDDVKEVIETFIHHRFDKLWVEGHPRGWELIISAFPEAIHCLGIILSAERVLNTATE